MKYTKELHTGLDNSSNPLMDALDMIPLGRDTIEALLDEIDRLQSENTFIHCEKHGNILNMWQCPMCMEIEAREYAHRPLPTVPEGEGE